MLDELRNLFLRALKCDDGITATVLVDEWNEAVNRVQKVFDNMTSKASMSQPKRKKGEWISVKDKVPDNQNPVIVSVPPQTNLDGDDCVGYVGMAYFTNTAKGGFWCGTDGSVYGAIGIITAPTHWMPLPEPYKGGQE